MSSKYVIGDTVILDWDASSDPTTLALKVTDPAGTETNYTYAGATITKNGSGDYQKNLAVSLAGVYSFVWTSTGTAAGVQDGTFTVFDDVPLAAPIYCTLDELKSWAFPNLTVTTEDPSLQTALQSVSRWIDSYCQRRFWKDPVATTQLYAPTCGYELDVEDLVSVTTLKTDAAGDGTYETTWTVNTDYQLYPLNPLAGPEQKPYTKIVVSGSLVFPYLARYSTRRDLVQIVGVFGWPAIPDAVKQACLIMAARVYKRKESPDGVLGWSEQGVGRVGSMLDPDVRMLLGPYRKYPVMVG